VTRLLTLGTQGGPRGNADRAQPSNVLIVNGTPYLIDAGNGVARQLLLAGVPITNIRQIFITHNHDDHNADWGTLMGRAWTSVQYEPMTVYGPPGTESMRKGFLQYFAPNAAAHYLEGAVNVPPDKVPPLSRPSALGRMNRMLPANLHVPVRHRADVLEFVLACQCNNGGFSRAPVALPDLELTHGALQIIALLAPEPHAPAAFNPLT
jgi:ribonuclease BN (tRNA processing enzyme)